MTHDHDSSHPVGESPSISRRTMLQAASGAIVTASLASLTHAQDGRNSRGAASDNAGPTVGSQAAKPSEDKDMANGNWIDAHSHIWTPDLDRYPLEPGLTVDDLAPRSFNDDELMAIARPEGVNRVVLIQHNVYHGFNNSYLVDTWRQHPDRFRVVGMIDSREGRRAPLMRKLVQQGVTGFRITPARLGADWLQTDGMREMWKTAVETRQSMCCLINPSDLPDVDRMCEQNPDTPVVIDHFGRVGIDGQFRDADVANLCRLARHKHVTVKISAYYALGNKRAPHDEILPVIKRLLGEYGRERLMWASDCPYQLNGENTYHSSISLIRDRADFLTDDDRQWLLRKTAERVFFHAG